MNVVAEPTSSGGSVTPKFKQSTIDKTSYLGYITFTPTANRFFILDYTNTNATYASVSSILNNGNCNTDSTVGTSSVFTTYTSSNASLPSPYTANSLSSTDTRKVMYQTTSSISSTYTIVITAPSSASPTGITITRASFGN